MVKPLIGLVSGTYNRLPLLESMIKSFRDNLLPGIVYTITIVDGGSTDGTQEWCKQQSDIKLIEDGELLGAISAFTRGAYATDAKLILLANDDITFFPNSVIPAIVHLEMNMRCGAVAFRDNRPIPDFFTDQDYKTLRMAAIREQYRTSVIYAQVGLFRKWLGDECGWWLGKYKEMASAQVYAGDNFLSSQIWNKGYTVDEVVQCKIEDHVIHDELRQINYKKGIAANDSQHFYKLWPHGVIVNNDPQLSQQNKRAARILYLPIYEPGWAVQKHPVHGKRGLRDALARAKNKYGEPHIVQELDYLSIQPKDLRKVLMDLADNFKPDLILTQLQSPRPITAEMLAELRQRTGATVVNWNGDQAIGGLYSKEMLPLLRQIDLQLITNLDVVGDYEREHIEWAYWQIGYEEPAGEVTQNAANYFREIGRANPFDNYPDYPVVYLASLRTMERQHIAEIVREFGGHVFTPGDEYATLYNFTTSKFIYQRAKIIISDNGFTSRGFVSNRLFQALAAGGGVVLQQHVDGLDELTGLRAGTHYLVWRSLEQLKILIQTCLNPEVRGHTKIAADGTAFVRENYSFDAQVAKLMALIKERLGENEALKESIALRYKGRNQSGFGLGNAWPSGSRYEYQPGHHLFVHKHDIDLLLQQYPNDWERFEE